MLPPRMAPEVVGGAALAPPVAGGAMLPPRMAPQVVGGVFPPGAAPEVVGGAALAPPVAGGAAAPPPAGQGRGASAWPRGESHRSGASQRVEQMLPSNLSDFVGPPGQRGVPGRHGREGGQGPAGPPGQPGSVLMGRPGPAGAVGPHGGRGPTGARGNAGLQGEPGVSFNADAQAEGYLGQGKDLLQRADGLAQAHDQTSSILLMQLKLMERQLGWDMKGAQHADEVLASVAAQSAKLGAEIQEYRHRIMLAKKASADKEASQRSAQDAVEHVEVEYKAFTQTTDAPKDLPAVLKRSAAASLQSSASRCVASLSAACALALALPAALLER